VSTSNGRIFLLRHGETAWATAGKHTSRTDVELTDNGRKQAEAAGPLLPHLRRADTSPALVLVSPRARARVTAELAGLVPDRIDDRLVEWDYGDYEGITTPQIRESIPGWTVWTHSIPGGESIEQLAARADAVLADARAALPDGDVVLVGHGHFSRVLMARWIGLPAQAGRNLAMDPAAWSVLGVEREQPRLDHVNVVPELLG
jgi:probable phosphoglycerate mutase